MKEGHAEKINKDKELLERKLEKEKTGESSEKAREIHINKKTLVLIAGLPGSGKSTFAEANFPLDAIVSIDRIRQELSNNAGNQLVSDRAFMVAKRIVEERLKRGEIVVVDAQNLVEHARSQFYQAAESCGARVEAIFLNVTPEESIARDFGRGKKVGREYIKSRKIAFSTAERSLGRSERVSKVHVVNPDEMGRVSVTLPEDDRQSLEADKEFKKEAVMAETVIAAVETGVLGEKEPSDTLLIKAGSVLFVENLENKKTKKFWSSNFLPHQVIDAKATARRLHTNINDQAVFDFMQMILRQRTYLNLTTAVSYPKEFPYADELRSSVRRLSEKRKIEIATPTMRVDPGDAIISPDVRKEHDEPLNFIRMSESDVSNYRIEVLREAPEDVPMFLVGDVQGTYMAMRELAGRIREENLEKKKNETNEKGRLIVFVGDMADRGPYDAESVIYITSLVRSGRAMLVKGNHDENLLKGLKGEEIKSDETQRTVADIKKRLKPGSIKKIIEMLEKAPYYAEWKNLVVVHASLPRIPRPDEELESSEKHVMTHGAGTGRYVGGRADVWKLHNTVAHDPNILVVGGHTHEEEPARDQKTGVVILDASAEVRGRLWGMYYPELEFASAEEPSVVRLYEMLIGKDLPVGENLLLFIEYARQQGFIDIKRGNGEYDGLILASYSDITEMSNTWENYPVLRNFRGLILDTGGNIVARPFKKTHKAGEEISLDRLKIIPEKVFEKANGSLVIVYFWKGKWRAATKFSFENNDYTKPAEEMLAQMNLSSLDPKKTHLFEIILPNDSHIIDYGGRRELIFLNSIDPETGKMEDWNTVAKTAKKLGASTARDMTADFSGMTIADIYRFAQNPEGNLTNLEGVMTQYRDENGDEAMVKVKAREYDDKKFVRDRLDWEDIIEAFDPTTMNISPAKREELLSYNFDNAFARLALETRIQWVKDSYEQIVADSREFIFAPHSVALEAYERIIESGKDQRTAVEIALRSAVPHLRKLLEEYKGEVKKEDMGAFMGFLRQLISGEGKPEERLARYALEKIGQKIDLEKKKHGKNSFWLVPKA